MMNHSIKQSLSAGSKPKSSWEEEAFLHGQDREELTGSMISEPELKTILQWQDPQFGIKHEVGMDLPLCDNCEEEVSGLLERWSTLLETDGCGRGLIINDGFQPDCAKRYKPTIGDGDIPSMDGTLSRSTGYYLKPDGSHSCPSLEPLEMKYMHSEQD